MASSDSEHGDEKIVIPTFLRLARGSYGDAVRSALAEAGFEDLPRNGAHVLGAMSNGGLSAGDVIRDLGISKQAASQLIDTLVVRGYLIRTENPEDRRRVEIAITERGSAAELVVWNAVKSINAELAAMITPSQMSGLRAGLRALATIKDRHADER